MLSTPSVTASGSSGSSTRGPTIRSSGVASATSRTVAAGATGVSVIPAVVTSVSGSQRPHATEARMASFCAASRPSTSKLGSASA